MKNSIIFVACVVLALGCFFALLHFTPERSGGDVSRIVTSQLYDVKYISNTGEWILLFTDRYIIKVEKQPAEGWWVGHFYQIEITSRGTTVKRFQQSQQVREHQEREKSEEDKKNSYSW